jgi:hypothetical protein
MSTTYTNIYGLTTLLGFSVQTLITKTGGTLAGTVTYSVSNDGQNWVDGSPTTLTNVSSQSVLNTTDPAAYVFTKTTTVISSGTGVVVKDLPNYRVSDGSGGSASQVVTSIKADSNGIITGDAQLVSGTGISLVQSGSTITENISLIAGKNITVSGATINAIPVLASDPGTPAEGDTWYNSTSHVLKYYDGTAVRTIAHT